MFLGLGLGLAARAEEDLMSLLDTELPVREDVVAKNDSLAYPVGQRKSAADSGDRDMKIRDFYRRRYPEIASKIPEPNDHERMFWKLGDTIFDHRLAAGNYSILRISGRGPGYHLRWIGNLHSNGRDSKILEAHEEIRSGDALVKETFVTYIPEERKSFARTIASLEERPNKPVAIVQSFIEHNQNEKLFFSAERQLIAAQFVKYNGGNSTSIGATFKVMRGRRELAKAIVVDSDLDLATLYVLKTVGEIRSGDQLVP